MAFSAMLMRPLMMLALPAILAILPVKAGYKGLMFLAFVLWVTGGVILSWRGLGFIETVDPPQTTLLIGVGAALIIGMLKGKLILNKSSLRNIQRLQTMPMPQKLIQVYPLRSWILIGLMVGISLSLTLFGLDLFWRGLINLGIGMALIASGTTYLRYMNTGPVAPPTAEA
jgi:hypothetical protein